MKTLARILPGAPGVTLVPAFAILWGLAGITTDRILAGLLTVAALLPLVVVLACDARCTGCDENCDACTRKEKNVHDRH